MKNLTIKIFAANTVVLQDKIRTVRVSRRKTAKYCSVNAHLKVLDSTAGRAAALQSIKMTNNGWKAYRQQAPSSAAKNTDYDRFEIVV